MTITLLGIYIMTGLISIITAVVLISLSRLSGQARIKRDKRREGEYENSSILADETLRQTLFEEINEVENSEQRSREIADRVSDVFRKELDSHIALNTQGVTKKYETVIREKSQSEEIAWKKYNKVLSSKRETEAVIRSIATGLVVIDVKGRVIMMNPAAERLLGISRKDKIGRPVLEDLKKEQLISLVKSPSDKEEKEIEILSKDDETKKIIRSSSAIIEDENGQTVGMVSILSDITKQRELDQLKSDFVAKVSHELRTPIVTVQNALSLLLSKTTSPISEEQERYLTIAQHNLKRLGRLIDDLLDLSKLEASKMEMKFESHSIEKVVYEVCETVSTWAQSKNIKIEKKVQKNIPNVSLDFNRIIQVLNNIIGNAIKFTPQEGRISIEAGIDEKKENVFVTVSDTGPGIAKKDSEKVFDKFQQVGERVATDISGTGLGLSISKEIVELHGGKIWADSEEGQGAKFTFTLPLSRAQETSQNIN